MGGTSVGSDWRSDIAVVCYDHAGQELWNRRFDTLNTRDESVSTILLDDSSNVYCIGAAEGGRGSISRPSDSFLAKLSAEGDFCWSSRLDTTASDYFLRGSFTSDGNLLCVGVSRQTSYDFAMAKYTSSGRYLWSRTPNSYPSQYGDVPVDFALDSFGNAYLLGYTYVAADTRDICLSAHSSNGVPSWSSFYEGLYYGDDSPNAIALDDSNNVYVLETNSYGNGEYSVVNVLKIRVPMPTSAQSSAFLPSGLDLHQNYPNPFNPTTEIRYQIPEVGGRRSEVGHMTLKVYDLLGREVATLVNEVQQPGEHSVRFDAANLSSGVYLYRLVAGGYMQTRKMIVAK